MQTEHPKTVLAGRYALERELGRSGTGMSWYAEDSVLRRPVVVKILRPELADDPTFAERLAAETRTAANVQGRAVAHLLDTRSEAGVSYQVREHVEGRSLAERLASDGPLPAEEVARIGAGLLDALEVVHEAGVLHLDLKPENVLLESDRTVRLTDPGLGAAVRAACSPEDASRILAPAADAPEQRDGSADTRTDVFQAGEVLRRAVAPAGARWLEPALRRATADDPSERFPDAAAFAAALRAAVPERVLRADGGGRSWLRSWAVVPLVVVVVAAALIGLGLRFGRLELGGPLGIRPKEEPRSSPSGPQVEVLPVRSVSTFDPYGDGTENDSGVPAATDGDPATAWRSENYFDGELRKPGVGLLFDLGAERTVSGFRLQTPHPGYTFTVVVGDDPAEMAASAHGDLTAEASTRRSIAPTQGRYVLLWITSVVDAGDGYRAEVAEFRVLGPR